MTLSILIIILNFQDQIESLKLLPMHASNIRDVIVCKPPFRSIVFISVWLSPIELIEYWNVWISCFLLLASNKVPRLLFLFGKILCRRQNSHIEAWRSQFFYIESVKSRFLERTMPTVMTPYNWCRLSTINFLESQKEAISLSKQKLSRNHWSFDWLFAMQCSRWIIIL